MDSALLPTCSNSISNSCFSRVVQIELLPGLRNLLEYLGSLKRTDDVAVAIMSGENCTSQFEFTSQFDALLSLNSLLSLMHFSV